MIYGSWRQPTGTRRQGGAAPARPWAPVAIALLLLHLALARTAVEGAAFRAVPLLIPDSRYSGSPVVEDPQARTQQTVAHDPVARPIAGRPAGTTAIVVFITVEQTAGYFYHAFILFFNSPNLDTPRGAYKTEAVGGGSRNIFGVPSFIQPKAPWRVTARGELASASGQDCRFPAYLFPPWAACSWQNFSIVLPTSMSVAHLRASFAQTARCVTAHPVDYSVFGPNTNTYAYTALRNAGLHPGDDPSAVIAPGWGAEINSPCTVH